MNFQAHGIEYRTRGEKSLETKVEKGVGKCRRLREFFQAVIARGRAVKSTAAMIKSEGNHQVPSGSSSSGRGSGGWRESNCLGSLVRIQVGELGELEEEEEEEEVGACLPGDTFPPPRDLQELYKADGQKPFLCRGIFITIVDVGVKGLGGGGE